MRMEKMKFSEHLASHLTPEWRKQYIQYEEMKGILYRHYRKFTQNPDPHSRAAYLRNFEENFLGFCQEELDKVSSFYNEKQAYYSRILLALKSELPKFSLQATGSTDFGHQFLQRPKKDFKRKHDLEDAFSELYLGMVLLQNYQQLNYDGFKKILKKHDQLYETKGGLDWLSEKVDVAFFHIDPSTDSQIHEIEEIVTGAFQGNDRGRAMKKLRVPPLNEPRTLKTFGLGFFVGGLGMGLLHAGFAVVGSLTHSAAPCDWSTVIRLYRGYFMANLYIFSAGLNVMGWRRAGVNHVLIFELDPRSHLEAQHLFTISAFLTCALLLSLIGFLQAGLLGVPVYAFPVGLLIFNALFIVNPFNCFWREARWWVLRNIGSVLTSGFHRVSFVDFWLMDQMQSLTPILLDLQYSICAFGNSSGGNSWTPWWDLPEATLASSAKYHSYCSSRLSILRVLIRMLPSLVRFVQCIRRYHDLGNPTDHIPNAAKYFFSILAITSSAVLAFTEVHIYHEVGRYANPFFYVWIFLSILSTLYGYYWDVNKDWGLFDPRAEVKYLREQLVYSSKYYYYGAMGVDLVLRFSWAIALSITENQFVSADIMLTVTAPLEIGRRCMWNFFRLENEHLNNVGDFRAIRDIAIVPISHAKIGSTVKEVRQERDAVDGNPVVVEIIKIRRSVASDPALLRTSSMASSMAEVGRKPEV